LPISKFIGKTPISKRPESLIPEKKIPIFFLFSLSQKNFLFSSFLFLFSLIPLPSSPYLPLSLYPPQ
jgi:hypothetical protein